MEVLKFDMSTRTHKQQGDDPRTQNARKMSTGAIILIFKYSLFVRRHRRRRNETTNWKQKGGNSAELKSYSRFSFFDKVKRV